MTALAQECELCLVTVSPLVTLGFFKVPLRDEVCSTIKFQPEIFWLQLEGVAFDGVLSCPVTGLDTRASTASLSSVQESRFIQNLTDLGSGLAAQIIELSR